MSNAPANDEDDLINVEDIEQLCSRMSKYDPCFRISLIQYHLKRMGIACTDERLVKLLSLSFETMVNKISNFFFFYKNSLFRFVQLSQIVLV
jgi:hypothetical protein